MEQNQTTTTSLEQVKKELEDVCVKYGVTLVPVVVHQGNRTFSSIEIVPAQSQQSEDTSTAAE
jgi:hypothetical protein